MKKWIIGYLLLAHSVASFGANPSKDLISYARYLAPKIAGRTLSSDESRFLKKGGKALKVLINDWVGSEYFLTTSRNYIDKLLNTGGGEHFDMPGQLLTELIKHRRPYSEIVKRCESVDGQRKYCDSGAPYSAGVLTTRAFLEANKGRFNLGRASSLLRVFLCKEYPLKNSFEPKVARASLIPMFRDNSGSNEFGNGAACYSCHGQFSIHAQFFVRFDQSGYWAAFANGLQNPVKEPGASYDGFYTSHFENLSQARSEEGQILGQSAANLSAMAEVLTQSSEFNRCAVKNILAHFLDLSTKNLATIKPALLSEIEATISSHSASSTFQDMVVATFTNKKVIESVRLGR